MPHQALSQLLKIEHAVRQAESLTALSFVICNQTRQVVTYHQAILLLGHQGQKLTAIAVSDHHDIDRTSPLITWIEQESRLRFQQNNHEIQTFYPSEKWQDLSTGHSLLLPLLLPANQQQIGVLWLSRHERWTDKDIAMLKHLAGTYSHAIHAFEAPPHLRNITHWLMRNHLPRYLIALGIILAFTPIHLSVLAPAEVIAQQPNIITAPLQGVVKEVLVKAGDQVNNGQLLVQLDPQDYLNRYQIAEQDHLKAIAEWHSAQQNGFIDPKQKAKVAELEAQVQVKEAEKQFAYQQWQKTSVTSQQAGIAIIDDPMTWQGKPVVTGEKILQIADPQRIELKIMLPVADAIAIQTQAEVRFFPDTDPLNVIHGHLIRAAYQPEKTPEDVIAYTLVAQFDEQSQQRIGSRGTAKVYGVQTTLFYYLFRKPLTALRQWLGW